MILKNNQPKVAIVKGLISQFMVRVRKRPLGFRPTFLIDEKSTCVIIG